MFGALPSVTASLPTPTSSPMDFFGNALGGASPLGGIPSLTASSGSEGGSNSTGSFSVGAWNNGGVDEKWLIGGGIAIALIVAVVVIKS